MDNKNEILIYKDKDGITKANVTFTDEDIWLMQNQLAEIYKTSRENITMHISNIYEAKGRTCCLTFCYIINMVCEILNIHSMVWKHTPFKKFK